jgi:Uma2 family endonuclease
MATDASVESPARNFVLEGVPFALYRELRGLWTCRHVRMTYLDGSLHLMSPEFLHERGAEHLALVVRAVALASRLKICGVGRTTLWRDGLAHQKGSGKEADAAFYIGESVSALKGKDSIDLAVEPPPDLAIEVDNKADSEQSLPLYARLAIPEIWRFDVREHRLWFGRLRGDQYEPTERSLCIPALTPDLVLQALGAFDSNDPDETAWSAWLQDWALALLIPPAASESSPSGFAPR